MTKMEGHLYNEATDEIERLRARIAELEVELEEKNNG